MVGLPDIAPYPLPRANQLPVSIPSWQPDPRRCALLVHDMQSYFLQPFPAALRDPLLANVTALRQRCADLGVPVAFTAQPGSMSPQERGLLADFWGAGMDSDPRDREICEPLAPRPRDTVLTKWRYSAFFHTGLLDLLHDHGRDQLIVCGVYANLGVLISAVEAFSNDIETFVVADGVADFDEESHHAALRYAAAGCAVVATTDQVLAALDTSRVTGMVHR